MPRVKPDHTVRLSYMREAAPDPRLARKLSSSSDFPRRPNYSDLPNMSRHIRRFCTRPFQIRLEQHPNLPELSRNPPKIIIRETTQAFRQLQRAHDNPIIICGQRGVGKSTLLAQAVHHARSQERIVLYIPYARQWTHDGGFFSAAALPDTQPHLDGLKSIRFFDRPYQMASLFKSLLLAHGNQLKDIPSNVEVRSEITKDCENLHDLVSLGDQLLEDVDSNWRMNPEYAGGILSQFIEELFVSQCPAAIMIDDYTSLIGMTCMTNESQRRLHANSIRLIAQHLGRDKILTTSQNLNGPVILAAEQHPVFEEWRGSRVSGGTEYPIDDDIRRDASGRLWWTDLVTSARDAGLVIDVPELLPGEQRAICATFEAGRDRASDRLVALSGGRANVMRRVYATR